MNDKQLVAKHAATLVESGMLVGLGTGSTANYFIEELARRRDEGGLDVTVVASSKASELKAEELSLPLVAFEEVSKLDLYVDGADEVATGLTLLKGQGADLVKEKLLATAADQFLVLVDESKLVTALGDLYPIPIEVMPFAWQLVQKQLIKLGGSGHLRENAAQDGYALSSHGSLIADVSFSCQMSTETLDLSLKHISGIVEHGIFYNLATTVFVGIDGKLREFSPQSIILKREPMLNKNDVAPAFDSVNQKNKALKLSDYLNKKNVILYFYPKDDTPGCTIEANDFTGLASEFAQLETVIIGVSKDSCDSHQAFIDKFGLNFELLADTSGEVCDAYGVWQEVEKAGVKKMKIVRSTFLINKQGVLEEALYGVSHIDHASDMLAKVKAL